jgi:signal transduction histidine kinase
VPFNPERKDFYEIIEQNIKLLEADYWKKQLKIVSNIPSSLFVKGDINMMNLIVRNILSNAIKYTTNEGTIEINYKIKGSFVEIQIKDNGMGMSPYTKKQLFNPKHSASKSGTSNEKGTGLGLLLCKEFVEKHGGLIWAKSKLESGSSFYFTLPLDITQNN